MKIRQYFDWWLLLPIFSIFLLSLLIIFSINSSLALDQFKYFLFSFFLFFIFSNLNYRILEKFAPFFYIVSLLMLLLTFIIGKTVKGSLRWIKIGSLNFQSSEIIKPFLILFFSSFASNVNFFKIKKIILFLFLFILPDFLIFKQPDFGSSLVIFSVWLIILWSASAKKTYILLGLALLVPLSFLFWHLLHSYQQQRIISFLHPQLDPLGAGYHLLQAKITVGSGQLLGQGIGKGIQNQLKFLPERQTDFIFSSFSEELGFLGASLLLFCYFFLLKRILFFVEKSTSLFAGLFCLGVFAMIFFQVFINIGMNLGIVPVTGITLPLFSFGGSSLVSVFISLGIVQNIIFRQGVQKSF